MQLVLAGVIPETINQFIWPTVQQQK